MLLAIGYTDRRIALDGVRMLAKPYDIADVVRALNEEFEGVKLRAAS